MQATPFISPSELWGIALNPLLLSAPLPLSEVKAKSQMAKVSINAALVEDIISLDELKEDMGAVLATLKDDFSRNLGIRTSPGERQCQPTHTHYVPDKFLSSCSAR